VRAFTNPPATPFKVPWDELPSPAFERSFLLHWWATRGSWRPEHGRGQASQRLLVGGLEAAIDSSHEGNVS